MDFGLGKAHSSYSTKLKLNFYKSRRPFAGKARMLAMLMPAGITSQSPLWTTTHTPQAAAPQPMGAVVGMYLCLDKSASSALSYFLIQTIEPAAGRHQCAPVSAYVRGTNVFLTQDSPLLQAGVHGPHQHAVLELRVPQVQGLEKVCISEVRFRWKPERKGLSNEQTTKYREQLILSKKCRCCHFRTLPMQLRLAKDARGR